MYSDYDIILSNWVKEKLLSKEPQITELDVEMAFLNWNELSIQDNREKNRTTPPTQWFISENLEGHPIKVAFMAFVEEKRIVVKTAYWPDQDEIDAFDNRC